MAEIRLRNVSKRWGRFVAVHHMNLMIGNKEFIVILGPSGCGKTTTMRMIAGLEEVSAGDIFLDGQRINHLTPKDRHMAMVFQSYALYPNMTVYENICFPLKIRRADTHLHDSRVREAARMLELEPLFARKPSELSGGQRQRVALARAIVRKPKAFLMDEPLSNLDAKLRVSTRAQIRNLTHRLQITTLYVTHDQIEAMTLADRVVVMDHGRIQQIGTPADIYGKPSNVFVAGFFGSPPMNLIKGSLQNGVFTASGNVRIEGLKGDDGAITLGFRAEDARSGAAGAVGQMQGVVYTVELLGDCIMVAAQVGAHLIRVKADKECQVEIGQEISIHISAYRCCLFNARTGIRLEK